MLDKLPGFLTGGRVPKIISKSTNAKPVILDVINYEIV